MTKALRLLGLAPATLILADAVLRLWGLLDRLDLPTAALWLAARQALEAVVWRPALVPVEIAALLAVAPAAFLLHRRNASAATPTLVAGVALAALIAVRPTLLAPTEAAIASWGRWTLPLDWPDFRLRWEQLQLLRGALAAVACSGLIVGLVRERGGRPGAGVVTGGRPAASSAPASPAETSRHAAGVVPAFGAAMAAPPRCLAPAKE